VELLFGDGKRKTYKITEGQNFKNADAPMPVNSPTFFLQFAKIQPGSVEKIGDNLVIYPIAMVHLAAIDITV